MSAVEQQRCRYIYYIGTYIIIQYYLVVYVFIVIFCRTCTLCSSKNINYKAICGLFRLFFFFSLIIIYCVRMTHTRSLIYRTRAFTYNYNNLCTCVYYNFLLYRNMADNVYVLVTACL